MPVTRRPERSSGATIPRRLVGDPACCRTITTAVAA
ncbi:hypothetical protein ABIE78_004182 [Sinorhizobium fredii]